MRYAKACWTTALRCSVLAVALGAVTPVATAQEPPVAPIPAADNVLPAKVGKAVPRDLVLKGDAKCTLCHGSTGDSPVPAIGKTRHGVIADQRTPTCTSCHGESESHRQPPRGATGWPKPDRTFRKSSTTPIEVRSQTCLACHQGGNRIHWGMSAHAANDVTCSTCHRVHTGFDKVRDKRAQTEVCFECHKEQRAQISRPSRHPLLEGKMACSDCHNPHGGAGVKALVRDNVNDTCYQCHMEKRGPFLRGHQPVQENCAECHNPHGSINTSLLKLRSPFLCQQCHEPTSHRGFLPNLAGTNFNANIAARGCLNCHTNIHGTNNPASTPNERTFRR